MLASEHVLNIEDLFSWSQSRNNYIKVHKVILILDIYVQFSAHLSFILVRKSPNRQTAKRHVLGRAPLEVIQSPVPQRTDTGRVRCDTREAWSRHNAS